jgi:hypothetical protein
MGILVSDAPTSIIVDEREKNKNSYSVRKGETIKMNVGFKAREIIVFNSRGEEIYSETNNNQNRFDINTKNISAGSYFLAFTSESGAIIKKIYYLAVLPDF